jgi:hypothetical protein
LEAEIGLLLLLAGYPEWAWLTVPASVKTVIMVVTLLPLGVIGLMGIGGDSLLQYLAHIAVFFARRRKLHFRRIGYRYDSKAQKKQFPKETQRKKLKKP